MSFKVITHAYLLKISITHNKKQIPLLNLLITCISARSAPQILPWNDECTWRPLNLLIIGSSNSSANSSFWLIADLNVLPLAADFLLRNL